MQPVALKKKEASTEGPWKLNVYQSNWKWWQEEGTVNIPEPNLAFPSTHVANLETLTIFGRVTFVMEVQIGIDDKKGNRNVINMSAPVYACVMNLYQQTLQEKTFLDSTLNSISQKRNSWLSAYLGAL